MNSDFCHEDFTDVFTTLIRLRDKIGVMLSGVPSRAQAADGTESKHPVGAVRVSGRLHSIPRDPSLRVGPPPCHADAAFRMTSVFDALAAGSPLSTLNPPLSTYLSATTALLTRSCSYRGKYASISNVPPPAISRVEILAEYSSRSRGLMKITLGSFSIG